MLTSQRLCDVVLQVRGIVCVAESLFFGFISCSFLILSPGVRSVRLQPGLHEQLFVRRRLIRVRARPCSPAPAPPPSPFNSYYETIAGGSGAGPSFDGTSGVHTHMTNTRITDPEILERRYPVILREFSLRQGSGGSGSGGSGGSGGSSGGDGVVRRVQFRREGMTMSLLSERRSRAPAGACGGGAGAPGLNLLRRGDGVDINVGAKSRLPVHRGDTINIYTPGAPPAFPPCSIALVC